MMLKNEKLIFLFIDPLKSHMIMIQNHIFIWSRYEFTKPLAHMFSISLHLSCLGGWQQECSPPSIRPCTRACTVHVLRMPGGCLGLKAQYDVRHGLGIDGAVRLGFYPEMQLILCLSSENQFHFWIKSCTI